MPEIDNGSSMPSMTIRAGETIKNVTPSQEASSRAEEKTSVAQKNTESNKQLETAVEAVTQESEEDSDFVSGGAKARKLGERQRKLAQSLLDGASISDVEREKFKELVAGDSDLDKYFRKHFPTQYHTTLNEQKKGSNSLNELDATTRAKILMEELRSDKDEVAMDLAVQLHFTEAEADALKTLASKLENVEVNGKELSYEGALKRAARIIRPDKAKAGLTVLPSSRGLDDTKTLQTQAANQELVNKSRGVTGYKPDTEGMMKNFELVNQGYDPKERRFVMPESMI